MRRFALLAAALAACGFPKPPPLDDPGNDGGVDAPIDAELPPGVSLRVSPTGDDANDGLSAPVKTLKHALGLAAANPDITSIVLATGRYAAASGETFPYTVPPNLLILGPAGGGAILAGSKTEPGITIATGTLRDLELEDFTVAVTATGTASLIGLRIRTEATAARATGAAVVTIDNIDITGAPGACASGIELAGTSVLTANLLVTRALKTAVLANDQSQISLSHFNFTGSHCDFRASAIDLTKSPKPFALEDSSIDGGDLGISSSAIAPGPRLVIRNTTIQNLAKEAVSIENGTLDVSDSSFAKQPAALLLGNVNATLTNVSFQRHPAAVQPGGGQIKMRRCSFADNSEGFYVPSVVGLDLGTAEDPGNNIFQDGFASIGIEVEAGVPVHVYAVGNTWRPNVQGADGAGHYARMTLNGPVGTDGGQINFKLQTGAAIDL